VSGVIAEKLSVKVILSSGYIDVINKVDISNEKQYIKN